MTPKEKAEELFEKFYNVIQSDEMGHSYNSAKKCALVAFSEILGYCDWRHIRFLQEVKNEIDKL